MPACYLLVFISQLDFPFVEKGVKNDFCTYFLYIYMGKVVKHVRCYSGMFPAFPTLKLYANHSILNEL